MEKKIQERIARFGKIDEEEPKTSFKSHGRKFRKFNKDKNGESKEGGKEQKFLGKRNRSNSKKGNFKRFKGNKQS